MRQMKRIGTAAIAAMALAAIAGAGSASATVLEVGGTSKNESVSLTASLKAGTSLIVESTVGIGASTCTGSHLAGKTTSPYTGATVTGAVEELTFSNCDHTVTVHNKGQIYVEWTSGTNGRLYSEEAEITTYSTIHGTHINCTTGAGTLLGTLTGVKEGHAELHVNAVVNCGSGHLPSARWTGTYVVTSPTGLGVLDSAPTKSTTLEVGGITKNESVSLTASLKTGTSLTVESTLGIGASTCTSSHLSGSTSEPYTGAKVTGALSELTFSNCDHTVTVHNKGQLYVEHIPGTTNGRVYSENAEITTYSTIHSTHINCTTSAGTLLGTLTGAKEGHAELHINAVVNCGSGHLSSARWTGTYVVTSPTGLGVSA